jgi:hypothetical protein
VWPSFIVSAVVLCVCVAKFHTYPSQGRQERSSPHPSFTECCEPHCSRALLNKRLLAVNLIERRQHCRPRGLNEAFLVWGFVFFKAKTGNFFIKVEAAPPRMAKWPISDICLSMISLTRSRGDVRGGRGRAGRSATTLCTNSNSSSVSGLSTCVSVRLADTATCKCLANLTCVENLGAGRIMTLPIYSSVQSFSVDLHRQRSGLLQTYFRFRKHLPLLLVFVSFLSYATFVPSCGRVRFRPDSWKITDCTCRTTSGRPAAQFLAQNKFNVCEIACDHAGNLVSDVSELDVIIDGYRRMRESRVEVCMLCRDASDVVPNIIQRMTHMSQFFEAMQVTMIENDSADNTVELLRNWSTLVGTAGRLRVSVENYHLNILKVPRYPPSRIYDSDDYKLQRATRYGRMSILRNRCLQQVLKRPGTKYLIVTDADEDLNHPTFQMDGIAHSFGLQSPASPFRWNSVCANGVSRAGIHVLPHLRLERNHSEPMPSAALQWVFWDSLAYRDKYFTRTSFRAHQQRVHTPYDKPTFVESCFGGLAIYDILSSSVWKECSYEAHIDNDCEHVSFHNCLHTHNWRMLFNPRMMISYIPRKRRRLIS